MGRQTQTYLAMNSSLRQNAMLRLAVARPQHGSKIWVYPRVHISQTWKQGTNIREGRRCVSSRVSGDSKARISVPCLLQLTQNAYGTHLTPRRQMTCRSGSCISSSQGRPGLGARRGTWFTWALRRSVIRNISLL